MLNNRITAFVNLPMAGLDKLEPSAKTAIHRQELSLPPCQRSTTRIQSDAGTFTPATFRGGAGVPSSHRRRGRFRHSCGADERGERRRRFDRQYRRHRRYSLCADHGAGAHFGRAFQPRRNIGDGAAARDFDSSGAACLYVPVQIVGCVLGAWLAHLMFEEKVLQFSRHARAGPAQMLSEAVATFALVFCILGVSRMRPQAVAAAVALIITAGYWWTASTSFANPAITIARSLTDSFAGIRPMDAPGFIVANSRALSWLGCAAAYCSRRRNRHERDFSHCDSSQSRVRHLAQRRVDRSRRRL